jgi:hypothetical protein
MATIVATVMATIVATIVSVVLTVVDRNSVCSVCSSGNSSSNFIIIIYI